MVTFASGTAAPKSSATRPCRMPVAVCAEAVELTIRIVAIGRIRDLNMGSLLVVSYSKPLREEAGLWTATAETCLPESIYAFSDTANITVQAGEKPDRCIPGRTERAQFAVRITRGHGVIC